jgi:hypothetical protein
MGGSISGKKEYLDKICQKAQVNVGCGNKPILCMVNNERIYTISFKNGTTQ